MDRNDVSWRGYFTAPVTPFNRSGEIDEDNLVAVFRHAVDNGVHGILVNGSTGEWFSQTDAERRLVAEVAVDTVAHAVPVIVGVTCVRPVEAIKLAEHAESIGADAVMASPPPMAKPTLEELHDYYQRVFGATGLPAWIYNFPQDNGRPISVDELALLATIPNIVAVKQSSPDIGDLITTIERYSDQLVIFGHMVSRLGGAMIASGFGGDGHFGSGLLLGRELPRFFELVWAGQLDEANAIADRFEALMSELRGDCTDGYNWGFGGMQPTMKAAMNLIGQPGGYPRRPKLAVMDNASLAKIADILKRAGLPLIDDRLTRERGRP